MWWAGVIGGRMIHGIQRALPDEWRRQTLGRWNTCLYDSSHSSAPYKMPRTHFPLSDLSAGSTTAMIDTCQLKDRSL